MATEPPGFPEVESLASTDLQARTGGRAIATRDHDAIREWAARHRAEPATGEATSSGPATLDVNDRGGAIRFNFPGVARFRPIAWDEWFQIFDQHQLTFVYEREIPDRAHELWEARGAGHGHDWADWFDAERQLREPGGRPSARYRLVRESGPERT